MNIYVGNLSLEMTDEELIKEFSVFGQVKSVQIMNNKDIGSGEPNGYGYVEMASETEGMAAIAGLKGKMMRGRVVEVIESLGFSGHAEKNTYDSRRGAHFNRNLHRAGGNKPNYLLRS